MHRRSVKLSVLGAAAAIAACATPSAPKIDSALPGRVRAATAAIDDARLVAADSDPGNWLTHGRTYAEERHSPLTQINEGNVAQLGLAWSLELGTNRGVEATTIAVGGSASVTRACASR